MAPVQDVPNVQNNSSRLPAGGGSKVQSSR